MQDAVVRTDVGGVAAHHLNQLIKGEVAAIHVADFQSRAAIREVVNRILKSPLLSRYANAPDIGKIGNSYFETVDGLSKATYFSSAPSLKRDLDELFLPLANPADSMMALLATIWEPGAEVLQSHTGQRFFYGLVRLFDGTEALAHVDHLEWDDTSAKAPLLQLAFNTYLRVPSDGGELVIWDNVLTHEQHHLIAKDYGVDERHLASDRSISIKPNEGDLIIFDAQRVHAVRKAGGPRLTSSMFAILLDADRAFQVYS